MIKKIIRKKYKLLSSAVRSTANVAAGGGGGDDGRREIASWEFRRKRNSRRIRLSPPWREPT